MSVLDQLDAINDEIDCIDTRLDELPAWHSYHEDRIRAATALLKELEDRKLGHAKTLNLICSELEAWRLDPYRRADAHYFTRLEEKAQEQSDISAANDRMIEPRLELASADRSIQALKNEYTALQKCRQGHMAQRTKLRKQANRSYDKSKVSVPSARVTTTNGRADMDNLTSGFSRRISLSHPHSPPSERGSLQRSPSPPKPLSSRRRHYRQDSRGPAKVAIQQDPQSSPSYHSSSPPVIRAAGGQRAQKARSSSNSQTNRAEASSMLEMRSRRPSQTRAQTFEEGQNSVGQWLQGQDLESAGPVTLVTALIAGFGARQDDIPAFTPGRQQDLAAKARNFPDSSRHSRREDSRVVIQAWTTLIKVLQITFTFVGDRRTRSYLQGQQEALQELFVRINEYRLL